MAEGIDGGSVASSLRTGTEADCDGGRIETTGTSDMEEKQAQASTGENLLAIGSSEEEDFNAAEDRSLLHTIDGELGDDEDSAHNRSNLESNTEPQKELLSTRSDDERSRLVVSAAQHECQELINRLEEELQEQREEKQILQVDLGRISFFEDRQKRSEQIFQTHRALVLKQNRTDGASYVEENFLAGTGLPSLLEPRSCPPTGQGTLDPIPEPPVIPSRDRKVDPPPVIIGLENGNEPPDEIHLHGGQENDCVSGVNEASASCKMLSEDQYESSAEEHTCFSDSSNGSLPSIESSSANVGLSETSLVIPQPFSDLLGGDGAIEVCSGAVSVPPCRLPVDPSLSNVSMHSNEWGHLGARDRQPMQTLPVEPSEPNVTGINDAFLVRHSVDWGLLSSILQGSEQYVLSYDTSFPGDLYCHVSSWPAPLEGGAVGGSFSESLDPSTGIVPPSTSNIGCQPSASTGNLVRVDRENSGFLFPFPVSRSRGADRGLLSEEEGGSGPSQYAVENGDQQSTNVGTHSAQLPDLRHGVQDLCALVEQLRERGEQEGERERRERETQEAITPEQAVCRPFELPLLCTIESLDCNHNCEPEFWQGVARARAQIEENDLGEAASARFGTRARRWCTCANEVSLEGSICRRCFQHRYLGPSSEPNEHCCTCCACLEMNDGSQTGGERSRQEPDSQHDECCICLQDAFDGCYILPCSHKVHLDCYITFIGNGQLECPICGHRFLRRN